MAAYWNAYFGSNLTHVCNAYSASNCIWLIFSYNQVNLNIKFNISNTPLVTGETQSSECKEFIRVPFGEHIRKERSKPYEYLTVFVKGKDQEPEYLCINWKIEANRSFIVTKSGKVTPKKKGGEYSLLMDTDGINHKPS